MKIPLTIKHTEKDLPFFEMPKASLGALLDIEFKRLFKRQRRIKNKFMKENLCEHTFDEMIVSNKRVLRCEHIEKVMKEDKICKEIHSKITRMSSASILRNMPKSMGGLRTLVQER